MSLVVPRCRALYQEKVQANPELANLDVQFFASEQILWDRYKNSHPEYFGRMVDKLHNSFVYRRDEKRERSGVADILKGVYGHKASGSY